MRTAIVVGMSFVVALGGATTALTASNSVPTTTLGYGEVSLVGGTMRGISYTYLGDRSSGFTIHIAGNLLLKSVSASYDEGAPLVCVIGGLVTSLLGNYTPVTCTGTAPRDGMPSVTVTVS